MRKMPINPIPTSLNQLLILNFLNQLESCKDKFLPTTKKYCQRGVLVFYFPNFEDLSSARNSTISYMDATSFVEFFNTKFYDQTTSEGRTQLREILSLYDPSYQFVVFVYSKNEQDIKICGLRVFSVEKCRVMYRNTGSRQCINCKRMSIKEFCSPDCQVQHWLTKDFALAEKPSLKVNREN